MTGRPEPDGTIAPSSTLEVERDARVRDHLRRLLQSQLLHESGLVLAGHPILMALVVFLTWDSVPHVVALWWGVAVLLATVFRGGWLRTLSSRILTDRDIRHGVRLTVVTLGLCWGIGAALMLQYVPFADAAFLLVVLAGILAASVSTLAADEPSFFGFLASVVLPLFGGLLASELDRLHVVTAALVAIYGATLGFVFRRTHVVLVEHLRTTALLAMSEEAAQHAAAVMRDARDLAERTARARASFLANMSHEIRTPMNAVLGFVELILDTNLTAEQRHALELVRASSEALLTIVNDILDYSKIEADHLELETIPFDLPKLVHATTGLLAVRAREKHLGLLTEVSPDVPRVVRGDPTRLRQVLTNLVGNAIKFTDAGQVVVSATVEAGDDQAHVRFVVRDTGIGIARDQLEAIFGQFTQADASMTRRYGGTGLGLAISQKLVQLMGGILTVTSEVGRGSDFHFTIALPREGALGPAASGHIALSGRRILVVDDNPTNRRTIREMLAAEGVLVEEAAHAAAGLDALRRGAAGGAVVELSILDAYLPDRDGFELAADIRGDPRLSATRLLMLTSAGQRGDGERCRQLGIQAYLTKPISRADLLEALGVILAGPAPSGVAEVITRHTIAEWRRSLYVLLAEDNPVNQQVAVAMLVKRGHHVDVASNGREAVAAVQQRNYHVVLMDIQMPEMDGWQATEAIRALPKGRDLPIIAVTAHALSGERERCLAQGMTDYLAKPIKAHELFALIERPPGRPPAVRADETTRTTPPVDLAGFRSTMKEAGAADAVDSILHTFVRQAPERLANLAAAVTSGRPDDIAQAAHTLRGAAATIGAHELASLLEHIESAARKGDVMQAREGLEPAQRQTALVLEYLRRSRVPATIEETLPR